jgi:hypothetical protein
MKMRWGSVVFFKRLILAILLLAAVVPMVLSVALGAGCARLRRETETLEAENEALSGQLQEALAAARGAALSLERADGQLEALLKERARSDAARAREGGIDYQDALPDFIAMPSRGGDAGKDRFSLL